MQSSGSQQSPNSTLLPLRKVSSATEQVEARKGDVTTIVEHFVGLETERTDSLARFQLGQAEQTSVHFDKSASQRSTPSQ